MCLNNSPQGTPVNPVVEIDDFCPHCGSRNFHSRCEDFYSIGSIYFVGCGDCGAQGPTAHTRELSIKRWQQRFFKIETGGDN